MHSHMKRTTTAAVGTTGVDATQNDKQERMHVANSIHTSCARSSQPQHNLILCACIGNTQRVERKHSASPSPPPSRHGIVNTKIAPDAHIEYCLAAHAHADDRYRISG